MSELSDYNRATIEKSAIGYCAISFRKEQYNYDVHNAFVLNSQGDGWFRRDNWAGPMSKIGLCVQRVRITSKFSTMMGNFYVYKAKIEYIDSNTEEMTSDLFWLYVHKKFTLDEVMKHIEENKHKWIP